MEILSLEERNTENVPRIDLFNNRPDLSSGNFDSTQIIIIMEHCMQLDTACAIQIFIICATANYFLSRYAFMSILIGGALGFMRYVAV